MPNYCEYRMKIVGNRDNIMEFHRRMLDYTAPKHFYRIFEADILRDMNDDSYIIVHGNCAWSIEVCCRSHGYSNGIDLLSVNTKELDLDVEVWSTEGGMGFSEHYVYKHGECTVDEVADYTEHYWDKEWYSSFEECKKDHGFPECITEQDFDADGYYRKNSFGDRFGTWSI